MEVLLLQGTYSYEVWAQSDPLKCTTGVIIIISAKTPSTITGEVKGQTRITSQHTNNN